MSDRLPPRINQEILVGHFNPIDVVRVHEHELRAEHLDALENTVDGRGCLGVAAVYGQKCRLEALALSTQTHVLLICFDPKYQGKSKKGKNPKATPSRTLLSSRILCNVTYRKASYSLSRLVTSLHHDLGLRITDGIDILSATNRTRSPFNNLVDILGGSSAVKEDALRGLFTDERYDAKNLPSLCLRAWATHYAIAMSPARSRLDNAVRVDTMTFETDELTTLAKLRRDLDRLDALKPKQVKNDVRPEYTSKQGNLGLTLDRFNTRIRPSPSGGWNTQKTVVISEHQGVELKVVGKAKKVRGRAAVLTMKGTVQGNIKAVWTVGKEVPTTAEDLRAFVISTALQRTSTIMGEPFFQRIWNPTAIVPSAVATANPTPCYFPPRLLNPSQRKAVEVVISEDPSKQVVLIQGPPGTGKTTVISACVTSIRNAGDRTRTIWLVAQSNVAVKNVAEKLVDFGFEKFRLLVSEDFLFEWHDHLYEKVERNMISSNTFPRSTLEAERMLGGARVIICSLSMLANSRISVFVNVVPVQTVIVDEASQIERGDYLPLLHRFQPTLQKLACIGDHRQLPPFGQSDVPELQSVFDVEHLSSSQVFLDTQYRMPHAIGAFISKRVYKGKLTTEHIIHGGGCCRFIDLVGSKEIPAGFSWKNAKEVQAAVLLARKFQTEGKKFKIITPYDGQRCEIENALKAAQPPLIWEDKCFNVDSFQGNEEDHIIISVVRSKNVGFLSSERRTNVMLSRCKKSMIILSSKAFLEGKAKDTLVGKMAKEWGEEGWSSWQDMLAGRV